MKGRSLLIILVAILFASTLAIGAASAQEPLVPNTRLAWTVVQAPETPFTLWYSGSGAWLAEPDSIMVFSISSIADDFEGTLSLGNATWDGNDTDIAMDLVLGVWPWNPGLIIETSNDSLIELNATAYSAGESSGTIESYIDIVEASGTEYKCIIFDYMQNPTEVGEPQITKLAYDLESGILVFANTSYTFQAPYILVIELALVTYPSPFNLLLGIGVAGALTVTISAIVALRRRR
ncbi:MAG: hypothetical protein EAX95_06120 [Candidatus Thorarchaeota archaeon]|nr:hypothetical protein [Candidatus Thorarchaeota archaeon]